MAVSGGRFYTLVTTEHGDVYSFGLNADWQLGDCISKPTEGMLHAKDDFPEPHLLSHATKFAGEEVMMVAAGIFTSAAVTNQGSLFTWGTGKGLGHNGTHVAPERLGMEHFGDSHVVMADCGYKSTIVLTASGQVWTCGQPYLKEQLQTYIDVFCLVDPERFKNRKIVMVACGFRHRMAIDEDGMLWTWGANLFGELCEGEVDRGSIYPVAIAAAKFGDNKVVHVDGGNGYTMVVTEDGSLWACGRGYNGCLGIGILDNIQTPLRVGGGEMFGGHGVRMTSCGEDHTLIVGKDNRMWACGDGCHCELGMREIQCMYFCTVPTLIPNTAKFVNSNIMTVSAGTRHSVAVMCDGTIYTWGRRLCLGPRMSHRVAGLGQGDGEYVTTPQQLNPALFHGARIGHWYPWFSTHPDHAMAVAMGLHNGLGVDCQFSGLPPELLHCFLGRSMHSNQQYGPGILALIGLHTTVEYADFEAAVPGP